MFRETFKYYKRKVPPPDLTKVVDFSVDNVDFTKVTRIVPFEDSYDSVLEDFGFIPLSQWKIFQLRSHPGFIYIVNPLTSLGQRLQIWKALSVYTKPPSRLNLHAHNHLTPHQDWWSLCQSDEERKIALYKKLRWATLGYHHNWDTKVYSEGDRSEFPEDLKLLSQAVVKAVSGLDLEPQAAIINYYHVGSTLSGHTDHSEPERTAPLLSLSFGQDALFMIGGETVEEECETMLVKSGGIMIMSGRSRLCYHGVPLIRKTNEAPWFSSDPSWAPFQHYISASRININVRQVLPSFSQKLDY